MKVTNCTFSRVTKKNIPEKTKSERIASFCMICFLTTKKEEECHGHCADVVHGLIFTDALSRFPSAVGISNTAQPQAVRAVRRLHVNRQLAQNIPGMGISWNFNDVPHSFPTQTTYVLKNYNISAVGLKKQSWRNLTRMSRDHPLYPHHVSLPPIKLVSRPVSLAWCRSVSFSTG